MTDLLLNHVEVDTGLLMRYLKVFRTLKVTLLVLNNSLEFANWNLIMQLNVTII